MKFTIPKERYEVKGTFNGKTTSIIIEAGQTVTPIYDSKTKKLVLIKDYKAK